MAKQERKLIYVDHPVSPEKKQELVGKGFKIRDAIYRPKGEKVEKAEAPAKDGNPNLGYDSGDAFSDEQLREMIKDATGTAPGPRTSRAKLVEQFNELNAKA